MEGTDSDSLLFVYRLADQEEWYDAIGTILVAPHAIGTHQVDRYVLSDAPFPIQWNVYHRYILRSGYPYPTADDILRDRIEKATQINFKCSCALPPLPFYVSGNLDRKPSVHEVTVRFSFDTVDFLPHVQTQDSWSAWTIQKLREDERRRLEEKWELERSQRGCLASWIYRLFPIEQRRIESERRIEAEVARAMSSYYGSIPILAQSLAPFSGLYLPVSLVGIEAPGVLQLNELLDKRTFQATLYMSDTLNEVQTPIELVSRGEWHEGDRHHVLEEVIGSIIVIA